MGCCGRRRRHSGEFVPGQLGAVGAQRHGRSWGRYGAENCPNWLILLYNGLFLASYFLQNGNREKPADNEVCDSPEWVVPLPAARRPTASDVFVCAIGQLHGDEFSGCAH